MGTARDLVVGSTSALEDTSQLSSCKQFYALDYSCRAVEKPTIKAEANNEQNVPRVKL